MSVIFCRSDGVLECDAVEGGPKGGNGLDDMVTIPGLYKEGEPEPRLEGTEDGVETAIVRRSAASNMLGLDTWLLALGGNDAAGFVFVKVRVKKIWLSTSQTVTIILAQS
jgi:hypothetical protein